MKERTGDVDYECEKKKASVMKIYQGTSFFLSASKRHILPLIHHVLSSV